MTATAPRLLGMKQTDRSLTLILALELDDGMRLTQALAALTPALAGAGKPAAAVGIGYLDGGDLLISKRPGDQGVVDLVGDARGAASETFLLCAPVESAGSFAIERTPPMRYRSWLFAGGDADRAPQRSPRERAFEAVPDFLRRQLPGSGSLDLAFLLFLAELHRGGLLGNAAPERDEALPAFAAAARRLSAAEGAAMPPLLAASRRCLLAARGAAPLYWKKLAEPLRGLAVTDAPADVAAWTELPAGSLLAVGSDTTPRVVRWSQAP